MHSTRLRLGIASVVGSFAFASVVEMACSSFTSPAEEASDARADANASDAGNDPPCAVGTCRIVFVTSESFRGDFGGLDKGDTECDRLAKASTHPAVKGREFRAWLSAPDAGAIGRHAAENKPYVRVDGVTVASGWNQLSSASPGSGDVLQAPIQIDEKGGNAGMDFVWTGTTFNGSPSSNTCEGWTKISGSAGQTGRADRVDEAWTDTDVPLGTSGDCAQIMRLYCFEK